MCIHNAQPYSNNECSECDKNRQKVYAQRRKVGMALLHAAEARGLTGSEAVALLQAIDGATVRTVMSQWR